MAKKIIFYLLIGIFPLSGNCCSAFKYLTDNQVYVAKNFDWYSGQGYILKNSRNQEKCTYLDYNGKNTCWTSKFGSITFNQNGKEFPYGGINEKGLVVEMLWLKETNYKEYPTETSTISELEWIQYQLDNFSSVDDIIDHLEKLEIDPVTSTIHYFIADPTGKSVIIEFLNGEMIVSESVKNIQTITNSSDEFNTGFFEKHKSKFNQQYIPKSLSSSLRYCSIQNNLEKLPSDKSFSAESAFDILENVSEDKETYKTYWSIVYDLSNLKIKFKTYQNKLVKNIELSELDFESSETSYYELLSNDENQNIIELMSEYLPEYNYKLIQDCIQPKLMFNYKQLNSHQMKPNKSKIDEVFSNNHIDVTVIISTKETSGTVRYFLADSETNYRRQGPYGASVEIKSNTTIHKLYSLPCNKKYAYGAMHDINGNGFLDRNFLKMPKEPFAFSGKKRFFFLPPKFKKATFDISEEIVIEIK